MPSSVPASSRRSHCRRAPPLAILRAYACARGEGVWLKLQKPQPDDALVITPYDEKKAA